MKTRKIPTPLLVPLLGCIGGIYLQNTLALPWFLLMTGNGISLAALCGGFFNRHQKVLALATSMLIFFTSAYLLHLQQEHHRILQQAFFDTPITLHAAISHKDEWFHNRHPGELLRLNVHQTIRNNQRQHHALSFDCLCYVKNKTSFLVGDNITLRNITLKSPNTQVATDNPAYSDFLCKENIIGSFFISSGYAIHLESRPYLSLTRWLWSLRNNLYAGVKKSVSSESFEFFGLVFMGNKQHDDIDALRTSFNYWGLAHYLARSGLHIVLFIFIWTYMLRLVPLHQKFKNILLIILCFLYDLVSWTSIPFARAYYAFLLIKTGELLGYQTYFLHILSLVCLGILLHNPMQLFFLDFQLTFALTFTLVLFSHITTHKQS